MAQLPLIIRTLGRHYGPPRSLAPKDPFHLLMWEYVAYLADERTRASAFLELNAKVGLRPSDVAAAPLPVLGAIARLGGSIAVAERAARALTARIRAGAQELRDVVRERTERGDGRAAPHGSVVENRVPASTAARSGALSSQLSPMHDLPAAELVSVWRRGAGRLEPCYATHTKSCRPCLRRVPRMSSPRNSRRA